MSKEVDVFDDKNFGEESEMSSQTVDWGKPGDHIKGTFLRARHDIETQYGMNSIYEILADSGEFHKLVKKVASDKSTTINKGEVWSVWGRNDIFNSSMNTIRPGQVIKITFKEEKTNKMGNPTKMVMIAAPRKNDGTPFMNEVWLAEQELV